MDGIVPSQKSPMILWCVFVLAVRGRCRPLLPPDGNLYSEALKPEHLSDGKLLCALVMAINPSMMPQALPAALARIAQFLKACTELGVQKVDIFTPPDLMPAPPSNPDAVLHCLSSLARAVQSAPTWTGPKLRVVGAARMPLR